MNISEIYRLLYENTPIKSFSELPDKVPYGFWIGKNGEIYVVPFQQHALVAKNIVFNNPEYIKGLHEYLLHVANNFSDFFNYGEEDEIQSHSYDYLKNQYKNAINIFSKDELKEEDKVMLMTYCQDYFEHSGIFLRAVAVYDEIIHDQKHKLSLRQQKTFNDLNKFYFPNVDNRGKI